MNRILICGDSFAADFLPKFPGFPGWVNLLAKEYDVTNIAQAGISEYKILKQLETTEISKYDAVIVVHTSPNRVYIKNHPVHKDSILHNNCDLIYEDIKHHIITKNDSTVLKAAELYFKYIFDADYYVDCYHLFQEKIKNITKDSKTLHVGVLYDVNYVGFINFISFKAIFENNQGNINHFNEHGNRLALNSIKTWLSNNNL